MQCYLATVVCARATRHSRALPSGPRLARHPRPLGGLRLLALLHMSRDRLLRLHLLLLGGLLWRHDDLMRRWDHHVHHLWLLDHHHLPANLHR